MPKPTIPIALAYSINAHCLNWPRPTRLPVGGNTGPVTLIYASDRVPQAPVEIHLCFNRKGENALSKTYARVNRIALDIYLTNGWFTKSLNMRCTFTTEDNEALTLTLEDITDSLALSPSEHGAIPESYNIFCDIEAKKIKGCDIPGKYDRIYLSFQRSFKPDH